MHAKSPPAVAASLAEAIGLSKRSGRGSVRSLLGAEDDRSRRSQFGHSRLSQRCAGWHGGLGFDLVKDRAFSPIFSAMMSGSERVLKHGRRHSARRQRRICCRSKSSGEADCNAIIEHDSPDIAPARMEKGARCVRHDDASV